MLSFGDKILIENRGNVSKRFFFSLEDC